MGKTRILMNARSSFIAISDEMEVLYRIFQFDLLKHRIHKYVTLNIDSFC